ncbi:MAG: GcrA family cell cycle regulator [Tardiphaga sp.]
MTNGVIWTRPMTERLEALVAADHSYENIAAMLSAEFNVALTKNSCVGKGRRRGVPLRSPARKIRCRKRSVQQNVARRNALQNARRQRKRKARPQSRKLPLLRNLSLYQLTPNSCRWPTGHSPPFSFCGDQKVDGSSYCLKHTLIASPGYGRAR